MNSRYLSFLGVASVSIGFLTGFLGLDPVWAASSDSDQVAKVTQVQGTVKIMSHPGKTAQGPSPRTLFEGTYYTMNDAFLGAAIENGNILRAAPGGKAKVIYPNGDQLQVGPGSAYRIEWSGSSDPKKTAPPPTMNLMYGKIRAVVEKGGPRTGFTIRTKTATMGVRGTDLFIADDGGLSGTEVSVIRGKVAVADPTTKQAVELKSGQTVAVEKPTPPPATASPDSKSGTAPAAVIPPRKLEVRQTTKEELQAVVAVGKITPPAGQPAAASPAAQELAALEKKSADMTFQDIKKEDPKLAEQILKSGANPTSAEAMNVAVVQTLEKVAPAAPPKRKPYRSELEDMERDVYKDYFKPVVQ